MNNHNHMNKLIFVVIGIAIIIIMGYLLIANTNEPNFEIPVLESEEPNPESSPQGKEIVLDFSDGVSAQENP